MKEQLNVIIAEDHLLYRDLIVKELFTYNINCVGIASNGKELLSVLETAGENIVILDIEMPEMDGRDALIQIVKRYPSINVLITSQYDDNNLIEYFQNLGAKGFIPKNCISGNFQLFVDGIHELHNNGTYFIYRNENKEYINYTHREREIIPMICESHTSKEIATSLGLGEKVVEKHRKNIFKKTNSKNVVSFIRYSIKRGLNFLGTI